MMMRERFGGHLHRPRWASLMARSSQPCTTRSSHPFCKQNTGRKPNESRWRRCKRVRDSYLERLLNHMAKMRLLFDPFPSDAGDDGTRAAHTGAPWPKTERGLGDVGIAVRGPPSLDERERCCTAISPGVISPPSRRLARNARLD